MSNRPAPNLIAAGQKAFGEYSAALKAFRARGELLITASRGLLEARRRYPNHREFGRWLRTSAYADLSKNDRAAMISIARNEAATARFLKDRPTLGAPVLIWRMVRRSMGKRATRAVKGNARDLPAKQTGRNVRPIVTSNDAKGGTHAHHR